MNLRKTDFDSEPIADSRVSSLAEFGNRKLEDDQDVFEQNGKRIGW